MSAEQEGGKKKGPRGGIKHQPGRGHDRKSAAQKKKRFAKKAAHKRRQEQEEREKHRREQEAKRKEQDLPARQQEQSPPARRPLVQLVADHATREPFVGGDYVTPIDDLDDF